MVTPYSSQNPTYSPSVWTRAQQLCSQCVWTGADVIRPRQACRRVPEQWLQTETTIKLSVKHKSKYECSSNWLGQSACALTTQEEVSQTKWQILIGLENLAVVATVFCFCFFQKERGGEYYKAHRAGKAAFSDTAWRE